MPEDTRKKKPEDAERRALLDALSGSGRAHTLTPEEMIQNLQDEGYRIVKDDPGGFTKKIQSIRSRATKRWEGGHTIRFGVVSDTQLCSRKQQLSFLNMVYDRFEDKGLDTVFHAGDLVDGDGRVYPGQQFDLFAHGYTKQLDYATENYPIRKGMTTHLIGGNHDWSFWQRGGADILSDLAGRRSDIDYMGYGAASFDFEGIKIYLIHLKSGLTYARSYKLQKIIEQFAPAQKPDLLFAGDRHSWAHIPMYRNVYGWQMGCFQSQTDHEKRLGLYPEIGAIVVEVDYGTEGADKRDQKKAGHEGRQSMVSLRQEILPMYVPIEDDY